MFKRGVALLTAALTMAAPMNIFAGELLYGTDFKNGVTLPWSLSLPEDSIADFDTDADGNYIIHIYKVAGLEGPGAGRWDIQTRYRTISIEAGHQYYVSFKISTTKDCKFYPKIGQQGDPYEEYWRPADWQPIKLQAGKVYEVTGAFGPEENYFEFDGEKKLATDYKAASGDAGKISEFAFHLGGDCLPSSFAPYDIILADISLTDDQYETPITENDTRVTKNVRANQVGYFPGAKKTAKVITDSSSPLTWSLKDSSGKEVATGKTVPFSGVDESSGDKLHTIDFSDFKTPGKYYLQVDGVDPTYKQPSGIVVEDLDKSYTFEIGTDIYSQMRKDSLEYFYLNRSGIAIKGEHARAAGHTSDTATAFNYPSGVKDGNGNTPPKNAGPSSMDFTGGWYDAGDHGKYVVNGGISLWTMMNQYERSLYADKGTDYSTFALDWIPETGGKIPDILDEAKWEMDWMLKCQFTTGDKAGMVVHSMHDESWTALGVLPADDPRDRIYDPQSTAATLNMAACAAQAARLFKPFDSTYADKCLAAAEKAYAAAKKNPKDFAPMYKIGGGPYDDVFVDDEFYWAAAELYTTTGDAAYLADIKKSDFYLKMNSRFAQGEDEGLIGAFTWQSTAGLGSATLALGQTNPLPDADLATVRANIAKCADDFIEVQSGTGYSVPIVTFQWGSNSFIINQTIVMAYAYDYTKDTKYLDAAISAMDYLLGRNAMDYSYVTGYGEGAYQNPHHRTFAYQLDPDVYEKAPAGWLSGGPNEGCQDPWAKGAGYLIKEIPPQKCYIDNIEAWSLNEVTINWNAPLAWISSFLDENQDIESSSTPTTVPSIVPTGSSSIGGKKGDVNGDGDVDIMDAVALKKHILGTKLAPNGDVNGDGSVDIMDAVALKKIILGISK